MEPLKRIVIEVETDFINKFDELVPGNSRSRAIRCLMQMLMDAFEKDSLSVYYLTWKPEKLEIAIKEDKKDARPANAEHQASESSQDKALPATS